MIFTVLTLSLLMTEPLPGEITVEVTVEVVVLLVQAAVNNMTVKTIKAAAAKNTFFINSSLHFLFDLFYRQLNPFS